MIRCTVVEVFEPGQTMEQDHFSSRDLLPWADPYIAQLLARHQVQLADEPWDEEWDVPFSQQRRITHLLVDEASPPLGEMERPRDRWFRRGGLSGSDGCC